MIDGMVKIMKTAEKDDLTKKDYCVGHLAEAKHKAKAAAREIRNQKIGVDQQTDIVEGKAGEISAEEKNIKKQDARVKEATAQRKSENAVFVKELKSNTGTKKLLTVAKARLKKFYAEDASSASFVQETSEVDQHVASTTSRSVLRMLDTLIHNVENDLTAAKLEEKMAQRDYEELLADAAQIRADEVTEIARQERMKAYAESDGLELQEARNAEKARLAATQKISEGLHKQCDWLVNNYQLRRDSRRQEIEQLLAGKSVLNGADSSLLQGHVEVKRLRGSR